MESFDLDHKLSGIETDLRSFVERHDRKQAELSARTLTIEQALVSRVGGAGFGSFGDDSKSIGQQIIESEGFAALVKGARSSGRIAFKSLSPHELKIISGTWSAPPEFRNVMTFPPQPALPVRALMPSIPTTSNLVEFPVETSFANNAGYQVTEGTDKPQSDAAYTLQQQPICTVAHWLAASRQLLDDSTAFASYVNARMTFKLEQVIEQEILFGTGAAGHLRGIWTVASAATETQTGLVDSVGASISQLAALGIQPDAVIANPTDWWSARMSKASTSGNYLIGDPLSGLAPSLWGLRVALSVNMPAGSYLVGNFSQGCAVYNRMQDVLEVSREHSDYFIKNMVAVLVESRLAVCVFVPTAFVHGSVGAGS